MGPHGLVASYLHRDRRRTLGKLIAELAGPWMAAEEDRLRVRRDHERLRAAGAGPDHDLVFTDRVIVTLVHLRFQPRVSTGSPAAVRTATVRVPGIMPVSVSIRDLRSVSTATAIRFLRGSKIS
jgi:hypothetical protein